MNLKSRLKRLERQSKGGYVTITFTDNSELTIPIKQLRGLWFDVTRIHENSLYQRMKAKYDEGYPDNSGLIHSMLAYDKVLNRGLWNET